MKKLMIVAGFLAASVSCWAQWLVVTDSAANASRVEDVLIALLEPYTIMDPASAGNLTVPELAAYSYLYVVSSDMAGPWSSTSFQSSLNSGALSSWLFAGGVACLQMGSTEPLVHTAPDSLRFHPSTNGSGIDTNVVVFDDLDHELVLGTFGGVVLDDTYIVGYGPSMFGQLSPPSGGYANSGGVNLGTMPSSFQFNIIGTTPDSGSSGATAAMVETASTG